MCIHLFLSTYAIHVQMIFPKHVSVHIWNGNYKLNCLWYVPCYMCHMHHIRNENICDQKHTSSYFIVVVILFHLCHINNNYFCWTDHTLCDFIWNLVWLELFFFYARYIHTCYYMCNRHSNNELFKIQSPIWYM